MLPWEANTVTWLTCQGAIQFFPSHQPHLRRHVHLISKAPEEQGHDNWSPELCHDIEQAETPVPQDGNGRCCLCSRLGQKLFAESCIMRAKLYICANCCGLSSSSNLESTAWGLGVFRLHHICFESPLKLLQQIAILPDKACFSNILASHWECPEPGYIIESYTDKCSIGETSR